VYHTTNELRFILELKFKIHLSLSLLELNEEVVSQSYTRNNENKIFIIENDWIPVPCWLRTALRAALALFSTKKTHPLHLIRYNYFVCFLKKETLAI
jgi:hypothetical protein